VHDSLLVAWISLILAGGHKRKPIHALIKQSKSAEDIMAMSDLALKNAGFSDSTVDSMRNPPQDRIDSCLQWLKQDNCQLIYLGHDLYPSLLTELVKPPLALFVEGNAELLIQPQIAIVGSRNATPAGLKNTREFSAALAANGFVITSGLASGVDAAAHSGALQKGSTIAVMGTGAGQIYPKMNRGLAEKIREQGLLVTEYPPGIKMNRGMFPARNRIISGLSLGVLVTEASVRSGSLITARCALEQTREVFALPGSIHNPLARGCHHLIRQGAFLVENVKEIIDQLAPVAGRMAEGLIRKLDFQAENLQNPAEDKNKLSVDNEYSRLLQAMTVDEPTTINAIVHTSGLTADEVSSMLLIMELEGRVVMLPGGKYSKAS